MYRNLKVALLFVFFLFNSTFAFSEPSGEIEIRLDDGGVFLYEGRKITKEKIARLLSKAGPTIKLSVVSSGEMRYESYSELVDYLHEKKAMPIYRSYHKTK